MGHVWNLRKKPPKPTGIRVMQNLSRPMVPLRRLIAPETPCGNSSHQLPSFSILPSFPQ